MNYNVHLEIFEGPLDLLLYLIRKNDLDIYDIPISQITAEYLEYLDLMKELNLDFASEFLVMAATLMQIKSRMLLPSENTVEDEEEIDPRAELVARLLEYEKYKEAGKILSQKELNEQGVFYRFNPVLNENDFVIDATLFDLIESFRKVFNELPKEVKEIVYEEIPIEQKIREILDLLEGRKYINFTEILKKETTRMGLIVVFLAMLELIRLKQIVARQSKLFGEIRIYRVNL
jgi:segregation and condensation protein A